MHAVLAGIHRDHDAVIGPTMATAGYPADATSVESVELAEGVHQPTPGATPGVIREAGSKEATGADSEPVPAAG
jgi:hypothetical protein